MFWAEKVLRLLASQQQTKRFCVRYLSVKPKSPVGEHDGP